MRCGGEWQRTLADAAVLLKFLAVVEEDFSTSMLLSLRTLFEAAYYTEGGCPPFVQ